jgi:hypothetical protein
LEPTLFDDAFFDQWLNEEVGRVKEKIKSGEALTGDDKMILPLKGQSNPFYHLDIELRQEMKALRKDMDRRFDQLVSRIDRFMWWSLGLTVSAAIFVVNYLK